ncbi:MAG: beta-galactosidase trimerization domain-containing protein, partial [Actinoplanes sp.]
VPVDHARWAREVDVVAVDDYPSSVAGHLADRAFVADLARGWSRDRRWMLMEHAPGAVGEHGVVRPLAAGQARAAALTYLDRGATAVMYFPWRAGRGGAEQWHPAMLDTPVFDEICELGAELAGRSPVTVTATTALLYDEPTMWAWQAPHLPTRHIDYESTVRRWHGALDGPVDVLPPSAPLAGYRLVVAPLLYLLSADGHRALRDYAAGGGTLVLTFASGLVDDCCRTTPGALDDLIGARVIRHVPLLPDETVALADSPAVGRRWLDELAPDTATVLLRAADGRPVLLENRFGAGVVRYLATDLDDPRTALP